MPGSSKYRRKTVPSDGDRYVPPGPLNMVVHNVDYAPHSHNLGLWKDASLLVRLTQALKANGIGCLAP